MQPQPMRLIEWLVFAAVLAIAIAGFTLSAQMAYGQTGSNASLSVADPGATGKNLATESRSEGGETRHFERWVESESQKNPITYYQNTVATPNTPKPIIQPTFTPIGASPTPTAMAHRFCRICAKSTNTGLIVVGGSGVMVTPAIGTTGFEMSPGMCMPFPAKGGDCSGFWINAAKTGDGANLWAE